MSSYPRLALVSSAGRAEPSVAALAWLAGLKAGGVRSQYFCSRACPIGTKAVSQVAGLPGRHLDAWLMPDPLLRSLFARGAAQADLALVEGALDAGPPGVHFCERPGALRPIVEALDLPTVFLLPCPPDASAHFPHIPAGVDAIFLDGLDDPEDFPRLRRFVSLTTGLPVVGGVERLPEVREALRGAPRDRPMPPEFVERLSRSFLRFTDVAALRRLAQAGPLGVGIELPEAQGGPRFRVAYAMDEVFGGYFPDTLEALEILGANLLDFSPLRDERLPDRADLVMIGCGFPDHYAEALAGNVSLIAELRAHVCRGRRLYAEGGGTAYLGRSMDLGDAVVEGAGILPFDAIRVADPPPPAPVERTLRDGCWLGPAGTTVRGYLSGRWRLRPGVDPLACPSSYGSLGPEDDMFFHHRAVGGLIHLHLGALAEVMSAFVGQSPAPRAHPPVPS